MSDGELARWYARADLFALFSHYEAFGLVFFEAMAYGAPVLSHDVGSNRELLHTGAVVTPRFDRQAAAARLTELVNDDDGPPPVGGGRPRLRPVRVHLARRRREVPGAVPGRRVAPGTFDYQSES